MKIITLVLVLFTAGCACLLFVILNVSPSHPSTSTASSIDAQHLHDLEQLMHIISTQNETLYAMKHVQSNGQNTNQDTKQLFDIISSKDAEIVRLNEQLRISNMALKVKSQVNSDIIRVPQVIESKVNSAENFLDVKPSQMDAYCEPRFGLQLIEKWSHSEETWCESDQSEKIQSSLRCYPYKQAHKNDKDMFCEAANFVIDFSKVSGKHGSSKPPRGDQYLSFAKRSILATCKKTSKFNQRLFMPHNARQVSIVSRIEPPRIHFLHVKLFFRVVMYLCWINRCGTLRAKPILLSTTTWWCKKPPCTCWLGTKTVKIHSIPPPTL